MMRIALFICAFSLFSQSIYSIEKHDPFVLVTPPEAGAELLVTVMEQLTGSTCESMDDTITKLAYPEWFNKLQAAELEGNFIQINGEAHPEQVRSLNQLNYKVIFLLRDPRDQAISLALNPEQKYFSDFHEDIYNSLSFDDKLHEILTGDRTGKCALKDIFVKYLPWSKQKSNFVYTVRFEDLVGKVGGGSRDKQLSVIKEIADFLNLKLSSRQIEERSQFLLDSDTLQTRTWHPYFKLVHHFEMQNRYGDQMKKIGYTNNPPKNKDSNKEEKRKAKEKKRKRETITVLPKK